METTTNVETLYVLVHSSNLWTLATSTVYPYLAELKQEGQHIERRVTTTTITVEQKPYNP